MMIKIKDSLVEQEVKRLKSDNRFNLIVAIVIAVLLFISYLNVFVFMNVLVSGPSMEKTLLDGDVVIVNKRDNNVKAGDIVIIEDVKDVWLIKRVIAVDKCTVEIKEDGYVYVDGERLNEEYLNGMKTAPHAYRTSGYQKYELEDGDIFYLGDNRWVSADSREYGFCTRDNIAGIVQNWSLLIKGSLGRFLGALSSTTVG